MTTAIIIAFCVLLLLAYLFDLTSAKTKIPSVILLLLLGWTVRQLSDSLDVRVPDFSTLLPVFGTVGLIMIVLEGALELELNRSKLSLIRKSFLGALFPILFIALVVTFCLHQFMGFDFKTSLLNALPLCVISSSIAIPSAKNLAGEQREFIIYESSLSDIIGVLLFNFLVINETVNISSIGHFSLQILIITAIAFVATIGLAYLLSKIDHHIKYVPIILLVILIYAVSKIFHLPGLVFILLFGLFLGNLDELKQVKWIRKFNPDLFDVEVHKFKDLLIEGTFIVRALFFILFGFLIESSEVLNADTLLWALGIVSIIFIFRAIQLRLSRLPLRPLLFIAPRGLITILLYLSIPVTQQISIVNKSLIIQVIILTAVVMMIGLMTEKTNIQGQ